MRFDCLHRKVKSVSASQHGVFFVWRKGARTEEGESQSFRGIFDDGDNLTKYSIYYYFHEIIICNAFEQSCSIASVCESTWESGITREMERVKELMYFCCCTFPSVSLSFSRSSFKWKICENYFVWTNDRIYKTTRSTMWLIIKIDALVLYICALMGKTISVERTSIQCGHVLNTLAFTIAQIIKI